MFELTSEDLPILGVPSGSEYTTDNYRKFFKTVAAAKAFAEKEYKKPIKWTNRDGEYCSGDLNYVMYTIRLVEVEDV